MKRVVLALLPVLVVAQAGAEVVTLDPETAAARAVEVSERRAAAETRVGSAEARVAAADAERLPVVDAEASVAHRSSVPEFAARLDPGLPPQVIFPNIENTYRAGVVAVQPLLTGGAVTAGREAARRDLAAHRADAARVRLDLRLEARADYWNVVAARAALEAARAEVERAQRLRGDARALLDAGMAVRADLLAADARLAAARVRLIEAETAAADRLDQLRSLLELPQQAEIVLTDRGLRLPAAPPEREPLVAEALQSRPELESLSDRIAALAARADAAGAGRRPRLSLSARWDLARPNERYLPLADEWNDSWSVGLSAGWRLFDGDRARAAVVELDSERLALEADRRELERRVRLDVELVRRRLESSLAAAEAADVAVAAAREREGVTRERYAAGLAPVAEVLDAQAELAAAELERVRNRAGAWLADASLRRAVGR